MREIKNAVITSATITTDNHSYLIARIGLNFGGFEQGFGGYALYLPGSFTHAKEQRNFAGHFIWRVLEIAGVSGWDQLEGKTIRVDDTYSKIRAIGHILKDDWFDPFVDFANS